MSFTGFSVYLLTYYRDPLTSGLLGFLDGSGGKESPCNAGDMGSIPGSGRSPGEEHGNNSL